MPIENRFLSALSNSKRDLLLSHSTPIALPTRFVCYRAEETPRYVYFPTSGMVSVVTSMQDGSSAEVGIVGNEGLVGCLHLIGPAHVSTNAFVQLAGEGLRIPFADMQHAYRTSEEIRDRVLEFVQAQSVSTSQIAGCNRLHEAEERLARWLLMSQDLTHSNVLAFTQEFLSMMLGSRRTTVTLIAGSLQKAGLIEYRRGNVTILDRSNLEAVACDCYQITRHLITELYSAPPPSNPLQPASISGLVRNPTGLVPTAIRLSIRKAQIVSPELEH
ncbi:MAG: Crp/Fnr family transcriptional regulator [Acidobacteria bacterium]|nr:Crp/Fnr family transcriptional regulator [Acidobacteriota bacterium]